MAARNPFELLVDNDSEDPSVQLKKIETKKPVVFPGHQAVAKSSSKPIAPSKTGKSDARGGARSNGHGRGAGGVNHRDNRNYGNNNRSYAQRTPEEIAELRAEREEEAKKMTLADYEKIQEEKKKALQAASRQTDDSKIVDKDFETMKKICKKTEEEVFIVKPSTVKEKKKKSPEKKEKAKKSTMSIDEFRKVTKAAEVTNGDQSEASSAPDNSNGVSQKENGVAGVAAKGSQIKANPWGNAKGANVQRQWAGRVN